MNLVLDRVLVAPSSRLRFGAGVLVALASHFGVGVAAASLRETPPVAMRETEIQALPDEPAPLPDEPAPAVRPEPPEPAKEAAPALPSEPTRAAAPVPAAAANVMTATDDAPADLTGGMVVGSAETFAGGTAAARGTGDRVGVSSAPPTLRPPAPTASASDRSRPPKLAEGISWTCPFPAEAEEHGIDDAVVTLDVEVAASGDVVDVRVDRDPGRGFGRVAASCARSKRFSPAFDRDGHPVAGRSRVNVRFHR